MPSDSDSVSRRSVLGGLGTVGTALVAGCSSAGQPTEGNNPGSPGSPRPTDEEPESTPQNRGVEVYEDVTYAVRDTGELKLDLYVPEGAEEAPVVVWIHGGGWIANTRKSAPDLEWYAQQGFTMATISHRLSAIPDDIEPAYGPEPDNPTPRGVFPDHIVDVKAAIRWIRANADEYGYTPEHIATWGASSGGHLATLAGTLNDIEDVKGDVYTDADIEKEVAPDESGQVQAVVGWYPPTDLLQVNPQHEALGQEGSFEDAPPEATPKGLLIGGPMTENEQKVQRADPNTYVSSDDPPFLLMHGLEDRTVPYLQSDMLYDRLVDAGIDTTYYKLHNLGHGFGDNENMDDSLTTDPRPPQSVSVSRHHTSGPSDTVVEALPPAGPDAIIGFLDRNLEL